MLLRLQKTWPLLFLLAGLILQDVPVVKAHVSERVKMTNDKQTIAAFRARNDAEILATDGVVSIATGLNASGKPCLKIGTSVPPEGVRHKLPETLSEICHEIEFVGKVEAQ